MSGYRAPVEDMKFVIDETDFEALVEGVVDATVAKLEANQAKANGRLGYPEAEAAALIGVAPHVLRDCRLRGEISARKVGKRLVYSRDALLRFLNDSGP